MIYKSPSNIALIKYMGKEAGNIPINASLSYALNSYVSGVKLTPISEKKDKWKALEEKGWLPIQLTLKEEKKFLDFFKKLKLIFKLKGFYEVQSANNFYKSAGVASSASSFSALTKATYHQAIKKGGKVLTQKELSMISRQGSGSSCRSFFSPWCIWDKEGAKSITFPFKKLHHEVVWIDKGEKKVPSSVAHQKVKTSPYFEGRSSRAEKRLKQLIETFNQKQWEKSYLIVKEEFEDMHRLFETSKPSFSYRDSKTNQALEKIDWFWKKYKDGPLVTMDAGANIHVLYRSNQQRILF